MRDGAIRIKAPSLIALMKNSERFMWLNIAIGLFVATLWYIGVALIFVEEGMEFKSTLLIGGAAFFGSALGLFYGLRLLVRMAFTRMGHMRKDDRWLGLDISIGLFAAFLWSGGAALILGGNSAEYTLASFVGQTLFGTATIGCLFALFFGLRALARMGLRQVRSKVRK